MNVYVRNVFISIVFLASLYHTVEPFTFTDNKDQGILKRSFLKEIVDTFSPDIVFETGTLCGRNAARLAEYLDKVHTVELHEALFKESVKTLEHCQNVHLYHGSSPEIIKSVLPGLKGRVLFWLDAHYSGPGTALSNDDMSDPEAVTAIRRELKAIKECGVSDCIILIDDIRGFGSHIHDIEYLGCWAYPTIQEVCAVGRNINPNFSFALLGDILLMYDAKRFNPTFSSVVRACTLSRLYDGKNLSDQELLVCEDTIVHATGPEKECIQSLYKQTTDYKDPLFLHDLWYALSSMGSEEWQEALNAIEKVPVRLEYFNKRRESVRNQRCYTHWRIEKYKEFILKRMNSVA